jgi:hypothetical protein
METRLSPTPTLTPTLTPSATGPCQRYPNATLCALVVRNESGKYVDKNTTTLPNQCSLDALAKSGSRDTDNTPLLYYRFYYEACADEDDWDGSRVFPLVIGVYTFILIILAFAISVAHGGKSGEYGVSNAESTTTIRNKAYQGPK